VGQKDENAGKKVIAKLLERLRAELQDIPEDLTKKAK